MMEMIACMAFLFCYAHGRFKYLELLQARYPQSFACAYGKESDLAMVAQHVKLRMLEILKQIGFVEPALKGEVNRITRNLQKGRT